jgi:hypothetical protein
MTQIDPHVFPKHLSESSLLSEEHIDCLSQDKKCNNTAEKFGISNENAEDPYDLDILISAKNNGPSEPKVPETKACTLTCFSICWTCFSCNHCR